MAVNAIELTEDLLARTDLTAKDASGVVHAISRAVESGTANLVTNDRLDARMAELRGEMAGLKGELKADIAELRAELHQALRAQTIGMMGTMIAVAGIIIAAVKLI